VADPAPSTTFSDEQILRQLHADYKLVQTVEGELRERMLADWKFVDEDGGQWTTAAKDDRGGRPTLRMTQGCSCHCGPSQSPCDEAPVCGGEAPFSNDECQPAGDDRPGFMPRGPVQVRATAMTRTGLSHPGWPCHRPLVFGPLAATLCRVGS